MTTPRARETASSKNVRPWDIQDYERQFIATLGTLDRGDLSRLRRAAGLAIREARMDWTFYRWLPPGPHTTANEELYFLVATLYPFNPRSADGNLGASLRQWAHSLRTGHDSLDRRVVILLDSHLNGPRRKPEPGELGYRLRQTVKLLGGQEIGIDWVQLLHDVCHWNDPSKWVQKQWAREYFSSTPNI